MRNSKTTYLRIEAAKSQNPQLVLQHVLVVPYMKRNHSVLTAIVIITLTIKLVQAWGAIQQ
jgi:hypothetical protein